MYKCIYEKYMCKDGCKNHFTFVLMFDSNEPYNKKYFQKWVQKFCAYSIVFENFPVTFGDYRPSDPHG